eukprot:c21901_g1_i1 orf=1662-5786(-)
MALVGHSVVIRSPTARSVLHAFDPGGNPQDRESQLWRDVIANPADWWDNRIGKRSPKHPDFRHKSSKEALWLDSSRKPSWVDSKLGHLRGHPSIVDGGLLGSPFSGNEVAHSEAHASYGQERPIHEDGENATRMCDTGIALSQKHEQLWKDLFSKPTEWWDNRMDKINPKYPDFRNKSTRESLWLDSPHKPSWVDQKLASTVDLRDGCAHVDKGRVEREAQNWKDLILNPSEWWDNRTDKKNSRQPDFRHRISGQPLWLDSRSKPSWVDFQLATFNAYHKTVQASKFDHEVQTLCEAGQLDRAMEVVVSMDQQGLVPTEKTYLALLKACKQIKAAIQAKVVHAHLVQHQLNLGGFLGQHLVFTLAKCGVLDDALQVFRGLSKQSVFTWTAMISGYTDIGKEKEAFEVYNAMQEEGVDPDAYTFVSLLRACGSLNDLLLGKKLHADILKFKCEADAFVGVCLIEMFAKCGSLPHAQMVFNGLPQRDVVSWTAMLSAYVEHGKAETALTLYNQMKKEGFSPDERAFVVTLQACCVLAEMEEAYVDEGCWTKSRALSFGQALHAEALMLGFDSDSFVGGTLMSMYGKIGHVLEVESVFQRLSAKSVASWTVMVMVYAEQGLGEMALSGYKQMQLEGFMPNEWTFVVALQACCALAEQEEERVALMGAQSNDEISLTFGKELHEDARKQGLDKDVFVGSSLLTMYSKCGNLLEAEIVFEHMPVHNVVSYNSMLSAYLEQGQGEKVPWLYKQMQVEGVSASDCTIVIALQACCMLAEKEEASQVCGQKSAKLVSLKHCLELHTDVMKKGFDSRLFVVSALVNAFSKCGSLLEAENVFDQFPERDVVSWNGMLTAYAEQGDGEKVLHLYRQMQENRVLPDAVTLLCALQACSEVRNLDFCTQIHFSIASASYDSDLYLAKALIHVYGSCGSVLDAQAIFDVLPLKSVSLSNALIAAYVRQGHPVASHERNDKEKLELRIACAKKALQLCEDMQSKGMTNEQTIIHALQACCKLAEAEKDSENNGGLVETSLKIGQAWHSELHKRGFESNLFLGSALVSMYGKCRRILEAEMVFNGLAHLNLMLWNAMLSVYSEHGEGEKVLQLHRQMEKEGVVVADWMLICVLQACISTGDIKMCRKIHRDIVLVGFDSCLAVTNTLMHVYGSCACIADAQATFDVLDPNVVSWTALIAAYARQGDYAESLRWYEKMLGDGIRPNGVTFLSVLSACNHAGFVDKAFDCFTSMKTEYGLAPDMEHYGIMLDLLGRAGDFVGVENLLSEMPMQPDLEMWLCLLGSCRKHGNVELGKQAFDCAMQLQPKHAGAHVLMSNIFADTVLQESVEKANKRWGSGVWEKYNERWVQHEQTVPLLWEEMAVDFENQTYP